jgi:hypothetical protein
VPADYRHLRLYNVADHESIQIRCKCGSSIEFIRGRLQRRFRLPSDTLIYDLRYRLRCTKCDSTDGFRIAVIDRAAHPRVGEGFPEKVVVENGQCR